MIVTADSRAKKAGMGQEWGNVPVVLTFFADPLKCSFQAANGEGWNSLSALEIAVRDC